MSTEPQPRPFKVIDEETCREETESTHESVAAYKLRTLCNWSNGHEEWHRDKLETRLRHIEDRLLWVWASGATIGVLFTAAMAVLGVVTGIIKWQ